MATIDTHRASYQRPNPSLTVGKRETLPVSPTITEEKRVYYTIRLSSGKQRTCNSISEVNAILAVNPNVSVVKTTKTTTVSTRHQRVK